MTFESIVFRRGIEACASATAEAAAAFVDLNLDQVIGALTAGKDEYDLKPLYHTPLATLEAIAYRHRVFQDLENPAIHQSITSFAQKMRSIRAYLAEAAKLYYPRQKQSWFLAAVEIYCDATRGLADAFSGLDLQSEGLIGFREYLIDYVGSQSFKSRFAEMTALATELAAIRYDVLVGEGGFTVRKYADEPDYSLEIEATFAKFQTQAAKSYLIQYSEINEMNHIEAAILDFVARLYPEVFTELDNFSIRHADFMDPTIRSFDREVQFYIAYLDYAAVLKRAGLAFCYPEVADVDKEVEVRDGFDVALAQKLVAAAAPVVCNDFHLTGPERILVVSGPNQGGKTTFARSFGQLHYLASLGCPVPGRQARLFLCDRLFTHFEKEESIATLRGKLEDDLFRIHDILSRASANSIIIMNEIFTSTTLRDAVFLSKEILGRVMQLDALCVCVTFIDELATLSRKTVSMVSTVVPENPALRTFKVVRRPADGLAYAMAIAEKYRLTYDALRERIAG